MNSDWTDNDILGVDDIIPRKLPSLEKQDKRAAKVHTTLKSFYTLKRDIEESDNSDKLSEFNDRIDTAERVETFPESKPPPCNNEILSLYNEPYTASLTPRDSDKTLYCNYNGFEKCEKNSVSNKLLCSGIKKEKKRNKIK